MGKHVQYDAGARDEIAAFFQNRAAALSRGDDAAFAAAFQTPLTVPVGRHQKFFAATQAEMTGIVNQYRANLLVECYDQTVCQVIRYATAPGGAVQTLVRWRHLNTRGAEITRIDADHVSIRQHDGHWVDRHVQFLSEPKQRLIAGLPIHHVLRKGEIKHLLGS
ncbi:MAG: hypothetical protein AAFY65_14230 [Pseudomonadota bacterium]